MEGVFEWTWRGHRHLPLGGAACQRIRTRDFFSAIDKQVGEKGEKAVYYVYFVPKSPYCSSISVPELYMQCTRYSSV